MLNPLLLRISIISTFYLYLLLIICAISFGEKSNSDIALKLDSLIKNYKLQHSIDAFRRRQDHICDRKFVVATYFCPQQVTILSHSFLNTLNVPIDRKSNE